MMIPSNLGRPPEVLLIFLIFDQRVYACRSIRVLEDPDQEWPCFWWQTGPVDWMLLDPFVFGDDWGGLSNNRLY